MRPHGLAEKGLNWDKGQIPYQQIYTFLTVAVVEYTYLYSYCVEKLRVLSELIGRPFLNLED
jgi:hypothetical protein